MPLLAHDRYCDEIAQHTERLRAVVTSGADLSPHRADLPRLVAGGPRTPYGGALRWVHALVRTRARGNIPPDEVPLGVGTEERGDAAALGQWLAGTGQLVVGALREAGSDTGSVGVDRDAELRLPAAAGHARTGGARRSRGAGVLAGADHVRLTRPGPPPGHRGRAGAVRR